MKNYLKYSLSALLAIACGIVFTACEEDEKLDLVGYPDSMTAQLYVAGLDDYNTTVLELVAYYDSEGELVVSDSISRTYVVKLDSPVTSEVTVKIEPIIVNLPLDKVTVSATEVKLPVGFTTAEYTLIYTDENMYSDLGEMDYELGIKVIDIEGFDVHMEKTEAKTVLRKDGYEATLSFADEGGSNMASFYRGLQNGAIIPDENISYTFKAYLARPAHSDVKLSFNTTGIPSQFAGDVTVSPSQIVIPAGELVSEDITWEVTQDFLKSGNNAEDFTITVTPVVESNDPYVKPAADNGQLNIFISKYIQNFERIDDVESSWVMYDRSGWSASSNSSQNASRILDGDISTDIEASRELWIIVDMKEAKQIAGIVTRTYNNNASYAPKSATIFTSDDGVIWDMVGMEDFPSKIATNHFKLISPVSARYIKMEMTGDSFWFAEFEVYGSN